MRSDLKERLLDFSVKIIRFCRKLPNTTENQILTKQLIRSATSIGANYQESQKAQTKKDFYLKISISLKEANETLYWLEIFSKLEHLNESLETEALEIVKIFSTIAKKSKQS